MEELYQHFRKEERTFIDQVLQWKNEVVDYYIPKLTPFLDPREQMILASIIGKNEDVLVKFCGGNKTVERKRALLYPPYYEVKDEDFSLQYFEIIYPQKFVSLSHRDVLGALMSLGIKREKFGDILLQDKRIQIIVAKEIADYVLIHLTSVGQAKVKLKEIKKDELFFVQEEWEEKTATVASLRLDACIAEIYGLSRAKAAQLIQSELVKVNWKTIDEPSFLLQENDYISVRRYGRSKLLAVEGLTKKGKTRIKFGLKKSPT